jgi:superfamily II DNA or RNA helicase
MMTTTTNTPPSACGGKWVHLRPYQTKLRTDIRDAFAAGHRCVLGVMPTGAGKTVTFADITTRTAATGRRVCIMAHRAELIAQISRALGDLPHGIIAAGRTMHPHRAVQVASVQTLVNRTHRYQFDLLIVDEAHHCND